MNIKINSQAVILKSLLLMSCLYTGSSHAVGVFSDDFESGLGAWTGQNDDFYYGIVVNDPIRPNNNVLTFKGVNYSGDTFTKTQFILDPNYTYAISFEYLGLPKIGSTPNDLGGAVGLTEGLPGGQKWYYATKEDSGATDTLVDDGKWHLYTFYVRPNISFHSGTSGNKVHLVFEDFFGSGGGGGDAFFDNVHIEKTPAIPENGQLLQPSIQQP